MATRPLTPAHNAAAVCNAQHFFHCVLTAEGRKVWCCVRCGATKGFGVAS